MRKPIPGQGGAPPEQITRYIAEFPDWRGALLARLRALIVDAEPELVEQFKWGVPVWARKGNVVAVAAFRDHVKLNFFKGATLADPDGLFNAGLDAKATRAIDFHEADPIAEDQLKALIRSACS